MKKERDNLESLHHYNVLRPCVQNLSLQFGNTHLLHCSVYLDIWHVQQGQSTLFFHRLPTHVIKQQYLHCIPVILLAYFWI